MALAPLKILYRGDLASCNYACAYCPFAKHQETRAERLRDSADLERFVQWVAAQDTPISVFFTPWGEALVRKRYQEAMARLSHLPHLEKVVAQTNGAWGMGWLAQTNLEKLALWMTFHPTQTSLARFAQRIQHLLERGVRLSVGVVGIREQIAEIEALRATLPDSVYVWVNAYDRRGAGYYSPELLERLTAVDPLFHLNLERYRSRSKACSTGHTVISVAGDGTAQRCHFIQTPIGNIYEAGFLELLRPTPCSKAICDCHIGYVHLEELGLYQTFAGGILERIPRNYASISGA
jgi:MoaA/NifB/PqqE/SkfB family radical SAM enzyme